MESKTGWNLNAAQTYLSVLLAAIPIILGNIGCTTDPVSHVTDCSLASVSFLTPKVMLWVGVVVSVVKFVVIPALQDGGLIKNLLYPKVPVVPASEGQSVGTVTPAQVKRGKP